MKCPIEKKRKEKKLEEWETAFVNIDILKPYREFDVGLSPVKLILNVPYTRVQFSLTSTSTFNSLDAPCPLNIWLIFFISLYFFFLRVHSYSSRFLHVALCMYVTKHYNSLSSPSSYYIFSLLFEQGKLSFLVQAGDRWVAHTLRKWFKKINPANQPIYQVRTYHSFYFYLFFFSFSVCLLFLFLRVRKHARFRLNWLTFPRANIFYVAVAACGKLQYTLLLHSFSLLAC